MYIVYVTSDSYSNYGVREILAGDKNPTTLLDALIKNELGGVFSSWEEMEHASHMDSRFRDNVHEIAIARKKSTAMLKAYGFKVVEAVELWLG